jgi:hypothetical protein
MIKNKQTKRKRRSETEQNTLGAIKTIRNKHAHTHVGDQHMQYRPTLSCRHRRRHSTQQRLIVIKRNVMDTGADSTQYTVHTTLLHTTQYTISPDLELSSSTTSQYTTETDRYKKKCYHHRGHADGHRRGQHTVHTTHTLLHTTQYAISPDLELSSSTTSVLPSSAL